ncbi:hypothetical protein CD170_12255 [Staphylococcus aureus]|nr:hypothetical protein CD170_12255 [Staphylococcus aureus]QOJ77111.1 hypothetical protein MVF7_01310 [Staphylococcus aureus]
MGLDFSGLPDLAALEQMKEKEQISEVIAPEHVRMHHDHQNKLKSDEKILLDQMVSHFKKFEADFKNAAQGAWVKKAKNELDDISKKLKNIQRTEV